MAHQLAAARSFTPGNFDLPLAACGQYDFHLMAAVLALRQHLHGGKILVPADELLILPRAVGTARAAQIQRLQQVRLALAVVAQQHIDPCTGLKFAASVIAEMIQFCTDNVHGRPPFVGDRPGRCPETPAGTLSLHPAKGDDPLWKPQHASLRAAGNIDKGRHITSTLRNPQDKELNQPKRELTQT